MRALPPPANKLAGCGTDAKCLMSNLGLKEITDIVQPLADLFDAIRDVKDMFAEMLTGLRCSKWGAITVPLTNVVNTAGVGLPGEICDFDVPYCESK